ncbi:uncharacterized protein UV8b_06822 [Ustilaginoidea virens]|uniref:BZIP domain-containing protein n=1 Tax=Ustilaginoidea virens TaxID=1159556 RepID=A0A8E5MK77_USTVR|nr:uncharacterized protein UV8b_06822 [Ustilaginoidea virens]QUC22581.1 hypothetical protein UV8b_06822 [Ustilaginoidea virens]
MTTPAQKANLARIRDNQRRSRARRREYLQELEQRLRVCELQGVEASAEVQMAARRVANENRQLRELLNRCGVSEEVIAHFLQGGTGPADNPDSVQGQPPQLGEGGPASHSLQQLMLPRRAAHLESGIQLALPSQSSREASIASGSTTNSSVWEPTMTAYSHHPQQLGVSSSSMGPSDPHQYSPSVFPAQPTSAQTNLFHTSPVGNLMNDPRHGLATTQPISIDNRAAMGYHFQINPFNDPTNRYGPPGGGSC